MSKLVSVSIGVEQRVKDEAQRLCRVLGVTMGELMARAIAAEVKAAEADPTVSKLLQGLRALDERVSLAKAPK